ncbi:unnamed protein product [Tilletia laevis]|nr:hypothetical protein CF336_g5361 [Tilletia laevis]KAE8257596.1 hypothetical protein A4X03_0g4616 [Tilletia caries]KAE8197387.1 hypothetical protein CF335_g4624 [Tilletia laevis]CAD6884671.1 unnamed protein product [Tilletia caries]CAD6958758.1 unnamed protein product [Tilletia laevis]
MTLSAMVLCALFTQVSVALPTSASSSLSTSSDVILGLRAAARPSFADNNRRIVIRQAQETLLANGLKAISWNSAMPWKSGTAWLHKPAFPKSFLSPATFKTAAEIQDTTTPRVTNWLDKADTKQATKEAAQAQGQFAPAGGRYTVEEKGKQAIDEDSSRHSSSGSSISDASFYTAKGPESDSWSHPNAWLNNRWYRVGFTGIKHK